MNKFCRWKCSQCFSIAYLILDAGYYASTLTALLYLLFCSVLALRCSVFVFILRNFYDLMKFFRRDIENATHLRPNWKQLSHYIFKWYLLLVFASFYSSIFIFHLYIKWVKENACQKCHSLQLTFLPFHNYFGFSSVGGSSTNNNNSSTNNNNNDNEYLIKTCNIHISNRKPNLINLTYKSKFTQNGQKFFTLAY